MHARTRVVSCHAARGAQDDAPGNVVREAALLVSVRVRVRVRARVRVRVRVRSRVRVRNRVRVRDRDLTVLRELDASEVDERLQRRVLGEAVRVRGRARTRVRGSSMRVLGVGSGVAVPP